MPTPRRSLCHPQIQTALSRTWVATRRRRSCSSAHGTPFQSPLSPARRPTCQSGRSGAVPSRGRGRSSFLFVSLRSLASPCSSLPVRSERSVASCEGRAPRGRCPSDQSTTQVFEEVRRTNEAAVVPEKTIGSSVVVTFLIVFPLASLQAMERGSESGTLSRVDSGEGSLTLLGVFELLRPLVTRACGSMTKRVSGVEGCVAVEAVQCGAQERVRVD